VTGFDILFFWVARMMMMGLKFMDQVPFKEVYIHALVRDAQGQKMSKSKGNVIDPLTIVDKYGADAFRFTLCAFAAMGRDIKLSTERIGGYRNFVNKLWNASRFALMNLADFEPATASLEDFELSQADQWILDRFARTAEGANQALTDYKFNDVAGLLYSFTWHEFCDWYVELSKDDLYGDDPQARKRVQTVLFTVLEGLLRLLHPLLPFVTEEIWQVLPGDRPGVSIMQAEYPTGAFCAVDTVAVERMELLMEVIRAIRNIRGELDVPPGRKIAVAFDCKSERSVAAIHAGQGYIKSLARVEQLQAAVGLEHPKQASTQVAGDVEVLIPLAGLINVAEEAARLQKEVAKVQKDVDFFKKKLSNEKFVANAPPQVLQKDRGKLAAAEEKRAILQQSLEKILALK
ncbi:MAG: class I tRNA ligase family protein, partial [Deltaproteobacteria bacterium]|nr:class I tRNA ligase family protein [Deltaproteobacteria bacterium]